MLINTLEFSRQSLEIHDKISVYLLKRVAEVHVGCSGELYYSLIGKHDSHGKSFLHVGFEGDLSFFCQRCLSLMMFKVVASKRFYLQEAQVNLFDQEDLDDDVDHLLVTGDLDVVDFVDQELLLELPMVVVHEGSCVLGGFGAENASNPFSVLKDFKSI